MTSNKGFRLAGRFVLPLTCFALAFVSLLSGEVILVETAGQPTVGPLVAQQVAVMVAGAFFILFLVTFVLAVFPGHEDVVEEESEPSLDDDEDLDGLTEGMTSRGRSDADIIAALKKAATKQTNEKVIQQKAREKAEERVAELEDQLAGFREGTSAEAKAMRAKFREEANRDALRKISELGETHDQIVEALRNAKQRTEDELAAKTEAMAVAKTEHEENLASVETAFTEQIDDLNVQIQTITDSLPGARREAAADEYTRVQIAVSAINENVRDGLDEAQTEAVREHAARVTAALRRLRPTVDTSTAPSYLDIPGMPSMPAFPVSIEKAPKVEPKVEPTLSTGKTVTDEHKPKRSRFRRR